MVAVLVEQFLPEIYTLYLSVFSPNAGKYAPEKTPYLDTFHTVIKTDPNDPNDH